MKKHTYALALAMLFLLGTLAGCTAKASGDLLEGVTPHKARSQVGLAGPGAQAATGFGLELLKGCLAENNGGNTLVSPLSVLCALSMAANGAGGETLAQMEAAFGMGQKELREYLAAYCAALPNGDKYKVHVANSLWVKEGEVEIGKPFLQDCIDYFDVQAYAAPFDRSTLEDVNGWVEEHTGGMIPEILREINPMSVLYLVNALSFDAEWQSPYYDNEVLERQFTQEDGTKSLADFLCRYEYLYLEDGDAVGFMKPYAGPEGDLAGATYAFAALLPPEGQGVQEYLGSLTGEKLHGILAGVRQEQVAVQLPKFKTGYSVGLSDVLKAMGVEDLFDMGAADLSAMGKSSQGPLYVGQVVHKTFMQVDEKGTKAGAAALVDVVCGDSAPPEKEAVLNRPFVYMVVDWEAKVPLFIGAAMDIAK